MKHFAVIAGLMLIGAQAVAAPPGRDDGDYAYRHNHYQYQHHDAVQVADSDHESQRSNDRSRDHRDNRDRNRDHHVASDRDRPVARDREHYVDRDRERYVDRDGDRFWDSRRSPAFFRPRFGHTERWLPERHIILRVRNHPYYYYGGIFYDYYGGSYIIVNAPIGAMVPVLPTGYISFMIGPTRYFYFGGTYYINNGEQYEVVEPPPSAHKIVNTAEEQMVIYPAKGQSQDQLDKDRYECHRWAVGQTGFDPSANNPDLSLKPDYLRAMSACLEARGYVVK